jgi:hypothetical protein
MSGGIFVSYRRDDAAHAAGRLVDRLQKSFRRDQIFFDIDNIDPGLDFVKTISEKVSACDVLLAVIGPSWLDAKDNKGQRRLDDPRDFVRIEIESALKRDVRVIPILVDNAPMPAEDQLPEPLRNLIRRQAVTLVHKQFAADADRLATSLEEYVQAVPYDDPPYFDPPYDDPPDDVPPNVKWEQEKTSWDFVKERKIEREIRDHIERYRGGGTESLAVSLLDDLVWSRIGGEDATSSVLLQDYLEEFPRGQHVGTATSRFDELEKVFAEARAAEQLREEETKAEAQRREEEAKAAEQVREAEAKAAKQRKEREQRVEALKTSITDRQETLLGLATIFLLVLAFIEVIYLLVRSLRLLFESLRLL